jgi:hypothetical protein
MDTIGGLQGFVEIKTVNRTTGKVTQCVRETNTLTLGALASIFATGLFEKASCYRCESPMANVDWWNPSDASWSPPSDTYAKYRYTGSSSTQNVATQYTQRDSRGLNNGLAGINHNNGDYSIFSAFAPNTFGVYLLRDDITKFDKYSQVPPYADDKCSKLASNIAGYNDGLVMENSGELESAQIMYGSPAGSFFNPAHLICARQLIRHEGVFMIKSVAWGSKIDDACCWGVRARIKGFDNAGYSHYYAIEHRLVGTAKEPQTILWQDSVNYYSAGNSTRDITGYNVTTGTILSEKVSLVSKPSDWMGGFMQGVVIGNYAFSVSSSGSSVTINRYTNWKSGDNNSDSVTVNVGSVIGGGYPVAVHNLATGKLEVFITVSKQTETYEVRRIIIDPITLTSTQTTHFLPYLITQSLVSVSGSGTRASTFVGFLDYTSKTSTTDGVYHLPFSKFINSSGKEITVGTFSSAWMYGYRVGVRFNIDKETNAVTTGSEFIVCGLYSFSSPSGNLSSSTSEYAFYSRSENYYTSNHDRVLQWCYTKTALQNNVLPVQMLPTAGPYQYLDSDYNNWAAGRNPFSLVTVSRVLCGLNLGTQIYKGTDDTLYVTYGWQLKVSDT